MEFHELNLKAKSDRIEEFNARIRQYVFSTRILTYTIALSILNLAANFSRVETILTLENLDWEIGFCRMDK